MSDWLRGYIAGNVVGVAALLVVLILVLQCDTETESIITDRNPVGTYQLEPPQRLSSPHHNLVELTL